MQPVPTRRRPVPGPWPELAITLIAVLLGLASSASAAPPRPDNSIRSSAPVVQPPFHLSCPSTALCAGVDGAGHALVSTRPTGTGQAWKITDIDGSRRLNGISCPSTSLCVAVDATGNVLVSTRPGGGPAAWRTTNIDGSTALAGVSCPSIELCVAVGGRDIAVSTHPAAANPWPVLLAGDQTVGPECGKYAPGEGCAARLVSVSCSSASFCAALDDWGQVLTSSDPAGGINAWTRGGPASGPDLLSLSCRSGSVCLGTCATGFGLLGQNCPGATYGDGEVATVAPGGRWASAGRFFTASSQPLTSVWCVSASLCFAGDGGGRLLATRTSTAGAGAGPEWSTVRAGSGSSRYDPIDDVSCPAASACVALDNDANVYTAGFGQRPSARPAMRHVSSPPSVPRFHRTATMPLAPRPASPAPRPQRGLDVTVKGLRHDRRSSPGRRAGSAHAIATTASTPVTYGLADIPSPPANVAFATCTVDVAPCPSGDLQGWFHRTKPLFFTNMETRLPIRWARFGIPYDALMTSSAGTCVASPAATSGPGEEAFHRLVWGVQAAQADNLTPVVAFVNGTGIGGVPAVPDPSYGTASSAPFGGWTVAAQDYSCGVQGIMSAIGAIGIGANPVIDWEAWNEPNGAGQFNGALADVCDTSSSPCGGVYNQGGYLCYTNFSPCGPLEAAGLWQLAEQVATTHFAGDGFQIAAMTVSNAQNSPYQTSYEQGMQGMSKCTPGYYCAGVGPTVWSIHDYDDLSSGVPGATADIKRFATTLNSHWGTNQTVWITESAVALEDGATSDNNCKTSSSNCGPQKTSNCAVGPYPQLDNTFGACVDGNPAAQTAGAANFRSLAAAAASDSQNVTQVDWYEFQAPNPDTGWDSALLSPPAGGYNSPDGVYGVRRMSFCATNRIATSNCSSSAIDATDWSTNQYQAANP